MTTRTKGSLSDFWRRDRSSDPAEELRSVLEGADILIGNMGSGFGVNWAGGEVFYTSLQEHTIALDFGPLRDCETPFTGAAVDEVIGYAAHEGGHCLWSIPGKEKAILRAVAVRWRSLPPALQEDWKRDSQAVLEELSRIQNILEDAYVDCHTARRWPILGEYVRIARDALYRRTPIDRDAIAGTARPHRNAVINLWISSSLYSHPLPDHVPEPLKSALEVLSDLARRAAGEEDAGARQTMAVDAATVLWSEFPVKDGPLPTRSLPGPGGEQSQEARAGSEGGQEYGESHGPEGQRGTGGTEVVGNLDDFDSAPGTGRGGRQVVQVPKGLLERASRAMTAGSEDISRPVAETLEEDPRRVAARTKKARYDPMLAARAISQVQREIREIRQVFRQQRDARSHWLHGLERGRLDDRRLWKPFVGDSGYYKRRDVIGTPSLAVGLLLDVSSSMKSFMPVVEQAAAVCSQGLLQVPGIDFAAWCYTGHSDGVSLTRICDRQLPGLCLADLEQGGGTPSGLAIAGARVLMEQMSEKRRVLLHFTDGQPDNIAQVARAIGACRSTGTQVYAIGLLQHRRMLAAQYGEGGFETIQSVLDLPGAVARIVRALGAPGR